MANKIKSIRIVSVLVCALVISLALVLYGTLSQLQDSKTATGTVTFNLADYDFQVVPVESTGTLTYPGQKGTTNKTQLINTYKKDDNGTTAGMGPVYIKMVINSVTIGNGDVVVEQWGTTGDNKISITNYTYEDQSNKKEVLIKYVDKNNQSISNLTIALQSGAWGELQWKYDSDAIYLFDSIGLQKAGLPFSEDIKYPANIIFDLSLSDPNVNNGFNAPTANDGIDNNKYQGQTVKINYTLYWATTANGFTA